MRYEILAVVAFCAVAFGGLGFLFVTLTDDINQPVSKNAGAQTTAGDEGAPPAGLVLDDTSIVLGSPSITTNNARDQVVVDFFECIPGSGSLDFGSGEVSFVMQGIEDGNCLIDYTADETAVACRVPALAGLQTFAITDDIPDLGAILEYCDQTG
jgi:hypothetical protein